MKNCSMLMMIGSAVDDRLGGGCPPRRGARPCRGTRDRLNSRTAQGHLAGLLVKAARRVNAVYEINPENEKAAKAIGDVAAIVEEYKLVASQFKGNKKEDPAPEPELESTTIS